MKDGEEVDTGEERRGGDSGWSRGDTDPHTDRRSREGAVGVKKRVKEEEEEGRHDGAPRRKEAGKKARAGAHPAPEKPPERQGGGGRPSSSRRSRTESRRIRTERSRSPISSPTMVDYSRGRSHYVALSVRVAGQVLHRKVTPPRDPSKAGSVFTDPYLRIRTSDSNSSRGRNLPGIPPKPPPPPPRAQCRRALKSAWQRRSEA